MENYMVYNPPKTTNHKYMYALLNGLHNTATDFMNDVNNILEICQLKRKCTFKGS